MQAITAGGTIASSGSSLKRFTNGKFSAISCSRMVGEFSLNAMAFLPWVWTVTTAQALAPWKVNIRHGAPDTTGVNRIPGYRNSAALTGAFETESAGNNDKERGQVPSETYLGLRLGNPKHQRQKVWWRNLKAVMLIELPGAIVQRMNQQRSYAGIT